MALIKCPECGKEISDKAQACIHCGYPIRNNILHNEAPSPQMYLYPRLLCMCIIITVLAIFGIIVFLKDENILVSVVCACIAVFWDGVYCVFLKREIDDYKFAKANPDLYRETVVSSVVECPYCHSTDTTKISTASKAVHTAFFGIFSMSRNSKQWHCNKCGSDF